MKQKELAVGLAAFLLVFSCVVHFASAQLRQSEMYKDKYGVQYRITELESPVQEVLWCGTTQATSEDGDVINFDSTSNIRKLYVLTTRGFLYYSSDFGLTLKQVNDDIIKATNSKLDNPTFIDIMISPVKNRKVYFFTGTGENFVTDNCGATYKSFKSEVKLSNIQPHPTDHQTLIGLVPITCKTGDIECNNSTSDLMLTNNDGVTWRKIASYVDQAQWDKTKQTLMNTQNRIIISHYDVVKNDKGEEVQKRKVSYTDNFGKDYKVVENKGLRFYQNQDYIFILKQGKAYGEYKLVIGPSYVNQSAARADIDLPLMRVKDESFTVLDVDGGQIMIAINHEGDSVGYTNVYISNQEGKQFNLSLQYTVGDSESNIDFEPINSNEGVYIANAYTAHAVQQYQKLQQRKKGEKASGAPLAADKFRIENMKKSKISFNKGGDWHSIKAPEYNYAGNPIKCAGDCSLNFKGRTESVGTPIYSSENAPGIILATGNVGNYLSNNQDDLRTYLSTDGGHTWKEVQTGSHEYEIADQGGIIAMARDDKHTSQVVYTIDEGDSWRTLDFKEENKFTVEDFVTEESHMEKSFLFYGKKSALDGTTSGVIGAINFANIFKAECKGFDSPSEEDSDYERWTPINFQGKKCLFGSKISYIRKKTDSACFNSRKVSESRMIQGACECTEEDFECDYGYTRDAVDEKKCVPMNAKFAKKKDEVPLNCQDYYYVSQGYRKIANNNCQGGIEEMYAKKKIRCPNKSDPTNTTTSNSSTDKSGNMRASQDGLFNRTPEEIKKEIEQEYGTQNTLQQQQQQQSGMSFMNYLIIFAVLFVMYNFRLEIAEKIKGLKYFNKHNAKKDDYGYKNSQNNAEQYSLFHNNNDDDNEECDTDQL